METGLKWGIIRSVTQRPPGLYAAVSLIGEHTRLSVCLSVSCVEWRIESFDGQPELLSRHI